MYCWARNSLVRERAAIKATTRACLQAINEKSNPGLEQIDHTRARYIQLVMTQQ